MKSSPKIVRPEDYILSVLSPEDRLDAAFKVAREEFKRFNNAPSAMCTK